MVETAASATASKWKKTAGSQSFLFMTVKKSFKTEVVEPIFQLGNIYICHTYTLKYNHTFEPRE